MGIVRDRFIKLSLELWVTLRFKKRFKLISQKNGPDQKSRLVKNIRNSLTLELGNKMIQRKFQNDANDYVSRAMYKYYV